MAARGISIPASICAEIVSTVFGAMAAFHPAAPPTEEEPSDEPSYKTVEEAAAPRKHSSRRPTVAPSVPRAGASW